MRTINLLPWRIELYAQRKKQFIQLLAAALSMTGLACATIHINLAHRLQNQQATNSELTHKISLLDHQLALYKTVTAQQQQLQTDLQQLEQWQNSLQATACFFVALSQVMPTEVYLTKLERVDDTITLSGKARSHHAITELIQNIKNNTVFSNPILEEVKNSGLTEIEFQLPIKITTCKL